MLDIKLIREKQKSFEEALKNRNMSIDLSPILEKDAEKRKLTAEIDALRAQKKSISEKFAQEIKKDKDAAKKLSLESENLTKQIQDKENKQIELQQEITKFLENIPNIPDESVPVGQSAKDNKVIREDTKIIMPRAEKPVPHWEIGAKLGILDFDTASKISGTRFSVLKGQGAALERALISFMLDLHIKEHGYTEILAPYLVNSKSMYGTGQLPKFAEELYKCAEDDSYLIPTAEVSVTNIHRDDMLNEEDLPIKYVSYSACFRREAGSYGKDTKGLIRVHQFNKVELVKFAKPEDSASEHEKLTNDAEDVLKKLQIPYRVVELCTGDLGFSSSKTYDIEVWMPGEKLWREISSCSNFKDFQARRMNIKLKRKDGTKELVHTLNGSGIAIGRAFAAILENYQQEDGSVVVPEVLKKYLGTDVISTRA